ncbi:RNA polymerase sigma factor [Pseudoteredinibacter isoporae]|uniref:RNA polymerase sigma-70 factor (ECF subfamily) n=1 Tax=Pseudoteredinibacter isoporae TaxID=570281 RepID=A0A7X0JUD6_9GAMM|nr:sigma-70 family RNA polymerase sigma factor [Pseudoteredinibacter isoporae]MBB6521561.1 RNA polymerase sigma-70 factor (ECF subfamily) [Pseudoteredinibacter isoporae]NHO87115.1 sigma-70 family RNA polymerase sigma factor [Pseudoteredinibacter isoporae]NIB22939.1 sigma-70 family RNA polymerase sigma factor [Pseudoteredinibacter isoporae]
MNNSVAPQLTSSPAQIELWVLEAQAGDQQAIARLYQHFAKALERYALLQCSNKELAFDACQDSWESCCRKLKQLQDPAAFRAWIFRAVRNRITDLARKGLAEDQRKSHLELEQEQHIAEDRNHPLEEGLNLWKAVNALPLQERQCVYLFYQEEFSVKEIALTLGIADGTVKSQLSRGREHLRSALSTL